MANVEVKPSPEGVPGAVTDPAAVSAEELTFAGAEDIQVNGYLARPGDVGEFRAERPVVLPVGVQKK